MRGQDLGQGMGDGMGTGNGRNEGQGMVDGTEGQGDGAPGWGMRDGAQSAASRQLVGFCGFRGFSASRGFFSLDMFNSRSLSTSSVLVHLGY